MNKNLILEIRIENIPARFILSAENQLKKYAAEALEAAGLAHKGVEAYGTYKRLVLEIKGLPAQTERRTQEFQRGPKLSSVQAVASDQKTAVQVKSFIGRIIGVGRDDVSVSGDEVFERRRDAEGNVISEIFRGKVSVREGKLCFTLSIPPSPAKKILAEILPRIISKLQFPKTMVWESTGFRFARPLRGLLALYGNKVIGFSVAGVKSGRITAGLSAKGSPKIKIESADAYFRELKDKYNVVVKDSERLEVLKGEIRQLEENTGLALEKDEELLQENLYLVEYPVCVISEYSQEFLKLPKELVMLVMKKQLKFFAVTDEKKELQPYFVGIRDGVSEGQQNVEEGFRNVMEARFRDAIFFYTRDLSVPLDEFRKRLSSITFQEKLGTMEDRAERAEKITSWLCSNCGADIDSVVAGKASAHVYSDLTSNLVREFPELQGTIGGYYTANAGYPAAVSAAVGSFYQPLSAGDSLPGSNEAAVVSLAGKIDTVASDFSIGRIPSGSEDPHALRRNALGIVRILLEKKLNINLKEAFGYAFSLLPEAADLRRTELPLDFIWQRAESVFTDGGIRVDEIRAVKDIFLKDGDLPDCALRIKAIHEMRAEGEFESVAAVFKRAKNSVKQASLPPSDIFSETLYEKPEEKTLGDLVSALPEKIAADVSRAGYAAALNNIIPLGGPLAAFFDAVMVMAPDPAVRGNRVAILNKLVEEVQSIADLSQLQ